MAPLIKIRTDGKIVAKRFEDLGAAIPKIGRQQIYNVVLKSKTQLTKPAKKPTYPIKWDSIRQKIKVIILLRYVLKEMPYTRKDVYRKGWKIVKQKEGYDLDNESDRTPFLVGDAEGKGQSRIAKGRYPIMRKVIDKEMSKLPSAVVQHIVLEAQKKGFQSG